MAPVARLARHRAAASSSGPASRSALDAARSTAQCPSASVTRPRAYWVPPAWSDVIERLELHGVRVERLDAPRDVEVEMYRIPEPKLATAALRGPRRA